MNQLKKTALLISLAAACSLPAGLKAQDIDRLYADMPERLLPVISRQQRTELLEYAKAGMGDSTANRFGRQAHLLLLDTAAQHLRVLHTAVSRLEMKRFTPAAGDTVIAVITTVCSPMCSSILQCYDTRWQERSDIRFRPPRAADWLDTERLQADEADGENLRKLLTADFIELTFDSTDMQLKAVNHTPDYLDEADRERLLPFLKNEEITIPLTLNTEH